MCLPSFLVNTIFNLLPLPPAVLINQPPTMTSSSSSSSSNSPETLDYDIIIIGAGIAGINTSYRIQSSLPGVKYAILEARDNIGGTWDLFRYPGVRSDASMYAYGFEWHPWTSENPIGTGEQIRKYLADAVLRYGIGKNIRFGHRVVTADWSTTDGMRWTMSVDVDGDGMGKEKKGEKVKENKTFTARWIVFGTGYYDYENPRDVQIPGLEKFRGKPSLQRAPYSLPLGSDLSKNSL